ncbi:MAG TPA: hypothetical protein VGI81_03440 [Tepidisphaeraceae bacterium]|jgi:hypothetical protein
MIGVFLRELRENLKWAAMIFAGLLVFVIHELRDAGPMVMFELAQRYTTLLAPIAGLLMGVVQSLFETKPDNWGFVVHRPVRRGGIFAAKCAAGLLLLYVALALPCLIASIWAAQPGHLPVPFQGRMVLPMLADVLAAGCYYFTGIVIAQRRARWFGTRLLPLGLALATSATLFMFVPLFWQAALLILIVQAIGATAAWGVFARNGEPDAALAPRAALGAMIYPGAIGVAFGLFGLSQAFVPGGGRWQYYQVARDGTAVRVTQTIEHGDRGWSYADPAGRPLPQYEGLDLDDPANRSLFIKFGARLVDPRAIRWPLSVLYTNRGYRYPTPGVVPLKAVAPPGVRLRFWPVYDVPAGVIDLFDPVTHTRIGTVGPGGFARGQTPPTRRFEGTPLNLFMQGNSHVMTFDSVVYWIELDQRRVRPVYTAAAGDPIFSAAEVGEPRNPDILVATRGGMHLIGTDGQLRFSVPWEHDPATHNFAAALLPSNHHLIVQTYSNPGVKPSFQDVVEYSPQGVAARRTDLPALTDPHSPKRIETMVFGAILPVAARPFCPSWILDDVLDVRTGEFARWFEAFMWGSAILCAALTLLIGGRCALGMPKTLGWSAANLLLGPAGVVVMLGLNDWPAVERCAACGRIRPAGRRLCAHCHAPLAPPPRDGREIFDPAEDATPLEALQPTA